MTNKTTQSLGSRIAAYLKRSVKFVRLSEEAVDDLSKSIHRQACAIKKYMQKNNIKEV